MGKLTKPGLSWQWLSSAVSARIAVKRGAGGSAADRSRASGRPLPDVRSYHPVSTAVPSGFDVPWLPVSHHPEERGFASLAPIKYHCGTQEVCSSKHIIYVYWYHDYVYMSLTVISNMKLIWARINVCTEQHYQ